MKKVCCFFGHRDTPSSIEGKLEQTIINLIENKSVDTFYVGNQGVFDFMVRKTLKKLKAAYPHINYSVVLAYMPSKREEYEDYSDTIYPHGRTFYGGVEPFLSSREKETVLRGKHLSKYCMQYRPYEYETTAGG